MSPNAPVDLRRVDQPKVDLNSLSALVLPRTFRQQRSHIRTGRHPFWPGRRALHVSIRTRAAERNRLSNWSDRDATCAIYLEGSAADGADARRSGDARCPESGVNR